MMQEPYDDQSNQKRPAIPSPTAATYRESGFVVCRACSIARR